MYLFTDALRYTEAPPQFHTPTLKEAQENKTSVSYILLQKTITKLWQDCESTFHWYKNTFVCFSAWLWGRTDDLKTSLILLTVFVFWKLRRKHNPRVSFFLECLCPYTSVASPARGVLVELPNPAPRHLAPIRSFKPYGSEVSVSSSFCLAAGRANQWATWHQNSSSYFSLCYNQ